MPSKLQRLQLDIKVINIYLDNLPDTLTHFEMRSFFGHIDHLPSSLEILVIKKMFRENIDHLPQSLLFLEVGSHFDKPIDHLPEKLQTLCVGVSFDKPIDNLPPGLLSLYRNKYHWRDGEAMFDRYIDHLPPSLTELSVGSNFDHPVDNLPLSLKSLIFGEQFNKSIDHLPQIESLHLGANFTHTIYHLPLSLKELSMNGDNVYINDTDNNNLSNLLPHSLTHLELPNVKVNAEVEIRLPPHLEVFSIGTDDILTFSSWWNKWIRDKVLQLNRLTVVLHTDFFTELVCDLRSEIGDSLPKNCFIEIEPSA